MMAALPQPVAMTEEKAGDSPKRSIAASLIAGLSGGIVSTVLLYPLDLVKVRLQVNEEPRHLKHRTKLAAKSARRRNPSALRVLRGVIRHEGIKGIYQGLTPAVVGSAASWGGYFFFYDNLKSEMIRSKHATQGTDDTDTVVLGPLENFTAACVAGAIMVGFTNPLWLIKTRMQLQMTQTAKHYNIKQPYSSMGNAAKTIVAEEGFWALYKGSIPALMLVSHGGVQFVAYEFLRHHFHVSVNRDTSMQRRGHNKLSITERLHMSLGYLTIGAVSKIIATSATYPIQVVKSRLQQRSESLELTASGDVRVVKRQYGGVIDCVQRIWIKEGVLGFFKGCIPNAIRVAPGAAITFVVYEMVMDHLS